MVTKKTGYEVARALRRQETPAEKKFWSLVRGRRFWGLKFLRQHPVFLEYRGELRFL